MSLPLRMLRRVEFAALFIIGLTVAAPVHAWQDSSGSGSGGTGSTSDSSGSGSEGSSDDGTAEGTDLGVISTQIHIDLQGKTISRVEEDWLIDVAVTDERSTAPEIVTVFGPGDPNRGLHAVFEMNHSTYPDFVKGGMQLQSWYGSWFLAARRHSNPAELLTTVERIQFTCSTRISSSRVIMEIKNGDSVTYGQFGNDGSLRVRLWTDRHDLNNYNPNNSLAHSRVTFGANRVNRYLRSEIRYYATDGTVITDSTDRYVHQLAEANVGPAPVNE